MKAVCDLEATDSGEHLYVMSASGGMLPGLVKVGRSKNPCQRALELQESQPFHIQIHNVFWGAGHREKAVHIALSAFRVPYTPGTEWFELPVMHAVIAVSRVLFGDPAPHRSKRAVDEEADAVEPGE